MSACHWIFSEHVKRHKWLQPFIVVCTAENLSLTYAEELHIMQPLDQGFEIKVRALGANLPKHNFTDNTLLDDM